MTGFPLPVQALIVVDVQKAGVTGDRAVPGAAALLERTAELLARARAAGALVVHLQNDGAPGSGDAPYTPGWELHLPVEPGPSEYVVRKTRADGFAGTPLGALLGGAGVEAVAVCGVMSEMCVQATARTALERDYRVVLPHDAHATQDVPAVPGISEAVPAAVVSRVAAWAVSGDADVTTPAARVAFTAPPFPAGVARSEDAYEDRGLDADGMIRREGALDRVTAEFAPVVAAAREAIAAAFGPSRLDSAYVYGSIPRGTAVPGVSDLDLQIALRSAPTEADRHAADALEAELDAAFDVIDGAGVLLASADTLLSPLERHDLGFFTACLCTPLLGDDLAGRLPRHRPTSLLARETNGDLDLLLPRWRTRAAAATTDDARRTLIRGVARRIVRTAFTLVMPAWNGWTSDLTHSAALFTHYRPDAPDRARQIRHAARLARTPGTDPADLSLLIDDLAPWLAAEHLATHGKKAPRP